MSYEKYETKTKGSMWAVWYRDTNNRLHKKAGFATKSAAKAWEAENVTLPKRNGDYIDPKGGRAVVGTLYEDWIAGKRGTHKPKYIHDLETSWRVHVEPKWGNRRLEGIRRSEVQSWVSELSTRRSATVTLRAHGVLKGIFELAIGDGLIRTSPCVNIDLPKKMPKERTYLTVEQVLSLSRASGDHATLVLVLGFCGLRMGEARGLRVKDVDFKAGRLAINRSVTRVGKEYVESEPKTWERRSVPIPASVLGRLETECRNRNADELVFPSDDGGYIHEFQRGTSDWWGTAITVSGVPSLTMHDLRHSAASIAISSGANVKAVQRMLGHEDASMTLKQYAGLFDADLDTVARRMDERIEAAVEKMSTSTSTQGSEDNQE